MVKEDVVNMGNETLFIKKNAKFLFATTWMGLEDIMFSEISQPEEDKCCILALACGT